MMTTHRSGGWLVSRKVINLTDHRRRSPRYLAPSYGKYRCMVVTLAAAEYSEGRPVAILHGLFGSGRNWATIAQRLATHYQVVVFDLRNHGASPWAPTMDYAEMAEDVHAAMLARGHSEYMLIGHSMGGKIAMVVALSHPAAVERLVVVDIAPVAYPVPYLGYVRAMRALDLSAITRRSEADALLADTIRDPAERSFLLQSLVLGDEKPRWRLNLEALETALPALAGFPTFPPDSSYAGPTLFIGGGKSLALRPRHEPAIKAFFPHAVVAQIEDAGHWVHAERPEAFLALVEPFLGEASPGAAL
jgi:esterase